MAKKKNPGGRPTVMTPEVIGKLEEAFAVDATHVEAAIYAGINPDTLFEYKKKHPEFSERIEKLRGLTGLKAKININKSINEENINDSKWYLERRDKDYKIQTKHELSGEVKLNAADQLIKALNGDKDR